MFWCQAPQIPHDSTLPSGCLPLYFATSHSSIHKPCIDMDDHCQTSSLLGIASTAAEALHYAGPQAFPFRCKEGSQLSRHVLICLNSMAQSGENRDGIENHVCFPQNLKQLENDQKLKVWIDWNRLKNPIFALKNKTNMDVGESCTAVIKGLKNQWQKRKHLGTHWNKSRKETWLYGFVETCCCFQCSSFCFIHLSNKIDSDQVITICRSLIFHQP